MRGTQGQGACGVVPCAVCDVRCATSGLRCAVRGCAWVKDCGGGGGCGDGCGSGTERSTPNSPLPPLIFLPLPSTLGMQGQGDGINKSVYDARGRRARTPEELMRSIGTKRQWQGTLGSMLIIPEDIVKTATSLATTALLLWNKSPKLLAGMVVMLYVNRRAQVRRREKKRRREKREEERRREKKRHAYCVYSCIVYCVLCAVCRVLCAVYYCRC